MSTRFKAYKIPQSVLVVIHTEELQVLLLRRADARIEGEFWQSVTGSRKSMHESLEQTAYREVHEETGIDGHKEGVRLSDWQYENRFEIMAGLGGRYAPGVTHNVEHVYSLRLPRMLDVHLNPREHDAFVWLPWEQAAERCFSWTNRQACLQLPERGAYE